MKLGKRWMTGKGILFEPGFNPLLAPRRMADNTKLNIRKQMRRMWNDFIYVANLLAYSLYLDDNPKRYIIDIFLPSIESVQKYTTQTSSFVYESGDIREETVIKITRMIGQLYLMRGWSLFILIAWTNKRVLHGYFIRYICLNACIVSTLRITESWTCLSR